MAIFNPKTFVRNRATGALEHHPLRPDETPGGAAGGGIPALHDLLGSLVHNDVLTTSPTEGDLIVANNTPAWSALTVGAGGTILQSDAPTPRYVAMSGDATIASGGAVTLASTAVTPAAYGSTSAVGTFTVDSKGRLTAAVNVTVDHNSTDNLTVGDVHTQYLLVAGTRPLSADWDNIGRRIRNTGVAEVTGVAPATPATGVVWLDTASTGTSGTSTLTVNTITTNTTLTTSQTVVLCDATSGAITVTLPAVAGNDGKRYFIKKLDSSANVVTVDANSAETIDDSATRTLTAQYDSIEIVSDGSEWWII